MHRRPNVSRHNLFPSPDRVARSAQLVRGTPFRNKSQKRRTSSSGQSHDCDTHPPRPQVGAPLFFFVDEMSLHTPTPRAARRICWNTRVVGLHLHVDVH